MQVEDAGSGPGARFRLREVTRRDNARDDAEQRRLVAEAKTMAQVSNSNYTNYFRFNRSLG